MQYHTTFSSEYRPLQHERLDESGTYAVRSLENQGLIVEAGMMASDVADIQAIATHDAVREYCPNDVAKRFTDVNATEEWLSKNGGRGMFLLRQAAGNASTLAGYGWTGREENKLLPECETTFALRLNPASNLGGRGIAALFTTAIVSGSMALYGARNIGLETWESNVRAVHTYEKTGAEFVTKVSGSRESLIAGGEVDDVRLFMEFSRTMAK